MYTDKIITCRECGKEFVFTAGEQEFYAEHGLDSEPVRCRGCRSLRRHSSAKKIKRVLYEIVCSKCGEVESIPFEPKHDRPVFCSECYRKINGK